MAFSILFDPQPAKFVKKLDNEAKERIKGKLLKLQDNPFPSEVERVEGYKGEKIFRVRVGDYRILYFVRYEINQIYVAKIDNRSRVYDQISAKPALQNKVAAGEEYLPQAVLLALLLPAHQGIAIGIGGHQIAE